MTLQGFTLFWQKSEVEVVPNSVPTLFNVLHLKQNVNPLAKNIFD